MSLKTRLNQLENALSVDGYCNCRGKEKWQWFESHDETIQLVAPLCADCQKNVRTIGVVWIEAETAAVPLFYQDSLESQEMET